MSDPVNQLHRTLRVLSEQDPTLQRAIAWVHQIIPMKGYDAIKADPGMYAWVMENEATLKPLADARRAAYAQADN